ncbi:MAG TPA: COX15/CtaA family protein [Gemmatimonadales bacterium]|nr:COX15/CtaA family protein [Gemmatimonadales bacterium]
MTRRFVTLAWAAAAATYLLIILGAIVRITGSGLGCGEHWPLCNGKLLPPLDLPTMIEYGHRLAAVAVSVLVVALAAVGTMEAKTVGSGSGTGRVRASYVAVGLLALQIALGAITVRLSLPAWTVILHLGTAMLLLAVLLLAARGPRLTPGASPGNSVTPRLRPGLVAAALGFVTILLGALTANMGAAGACTGFPLCNGSIMPEGALQHIHWTHRLLAYALTLYLLVWAWKTRAPAARHVLYLVLVQIAVAAAMVLFALPAPLQATHVAVGAAVWAGLVLAAR